MNRLLGLKITSLILLIQVLPSSNSEERPSIQFNVLFQNNCPDFIQYTENIRQIEKDTQTDIQLIQIVRISGDLNKIQEAHQRVSQLNVNSTQEKPNVLKTTKIKDLLKEIKLETNNMFERKVQELKNAIETSKMDIEAKLSENSQNLVKLSLDEKQEIKSIKNEVNVLQSEIYGIRNISEIQFQNMTNLVQEEKQDIIKNIKNEVAKVKVKDCSVYNTCLDCIGAKDSYCGWCTFENKCSLKTDCQDADREDLLYWISYKCGKCTTITAVSPNKLQRTTARTLNLVIENLPSLNGQFLCAFNALDKTLVTKATREPNGASGVNCSTPRTDLLPSIPPGQHHFTAKLSVRMTSVPDFVGTNFTFFDCNTYVSCTQCVSSPFPCDWCVDGHRCTHDTSENCRNDILITGVSRISPSYRKGPGFCPAVNAATGGSTEILVSSGVKKSLRVKDFD